MIRQKLFQCQAYLAYWLRCVNEHSLQPPFLYSLYTQVLKPDRPLPQLAAVERLRESWLHSRELLQISDFGAGSLLGKPRQRSLAQITRFSATPARFSRLLHRLIRFSGGGTVLELGTSLGLNSRYLADTAERLITFEGCPTLAERARMQFTEAGLRNIELMEGNIDESLPQVLARLDSFSLAYIDANHRYEPSLRYFELLLQKARPNTILVFDDIHWSAEMERAWTDICAHPAVSLSLDLYEAGIVFLNPSLQKEHYILSY